MKNFSSSSPVSQTPSSAPRAESASAASGVEQAALVISALAVFVAIFVMLRYADEAYKHGVARATLPWEPALRIAEKISLSGSSAFAAVMVEEEDHHLCTIPDEGSVVCVVNAKASKGTTPSVEPVLPASPAPRVLRGAATSPPTGGEEKLASTRPPKRDTEGPPKAGRLCQ